MKKIKMVLRVLLTEKCSDGRISKYKKPISIMLIAVCIIVMLSGISGHPVVATVVGFTAIITVLAVLIIWDIPNIKEALKSK